MSHIYMYLGVSSPFDPTHRYTTSYLLPPFILAFSRLLISLYIFTTTFFIYGYDASHSILWDTCRSFSYFTNLTYWGLAFYFLASGLHTLSYARTGRSWLQRWPRGLQAAHAVLYTSIVTFPVLVTVVFWAVLYRNPWYVEVFDGWKNISQHALNTVFALLEILLPRTEPFAVAHLGFLVLILVFYLALAYLTHATQGFYPYNFLDPSTGSGKVAGYCFGILAAVCVIFGVVRGLIWAKNWAARKLGMEGKFAREGRMYQQDSNGDGGVRGGGVEAVNMAERAK